MDEGIRIFLDPFLLNLNPCASSYIHRSEASEEVTVREARVENDLVKLQQQARFWMPWDRKSAPWALFMSNYNEAVSLNKPQVLCCLLYPFESLGAHIVALKTKGRKGLVTYNKAHGTTAMMKHVKSEHVEVPNRYNVEIFAYHMGA